MHLMMVVDLKKNINRIFAKGYEVDYYNNNVPNIIPNPATQQDNPTYNNWGWDNIDQRKSV